jgi:hypothetical protein
MAERWNIRERLETAKSKLRDDEGRVKELEGRLKVIRANAEDATGKAKVQLGRAERDVRDTIDTTLKRLNTALDGLEPRVRRALAQTKNAARGVRAGVRAGAQHYRQSSKKKTT